jgi:BirA family transcriptional regulator, biotin operon repressor / biotin---[acetyl-CoA-carboxylase] ligase
LESPLDTRVSGLPQWRHRHLAETGSTNTDCLAAARVGDRGDLWITAGRQVSGRGRLGRHWISEVGNLYASALILDAAPLARLSTLPFVAALALHATLSELSSVDQKRIKIKWPNDILIDGAKISGLLIESEILASGAHAVACGFGVNVAHHPDAAHYPTTDLKTLGLTISPNQLFERLALNFASILDIWNRGKGFAKIREEWLRHAKGIGEPITVNLPLEQLHGTFIDIDAQGCLVFAGPMGEERIISAGDVFFPAIKGN